MNPFAFPADPEVTHLAPAKSPLIYKGFGHAEDGREYILRRFSFVKETENKTITDNNVITINFRMRQYKKVPDKNDRYFGL